METTLPLKKLAVLCTAFLLAGCLGIEPAADPIIVTVLPTFTESVRPAPTATLAPTLTPTPLPTATSQATATPIPRPTATPTDDPCWQSGGRVTRHILPTDLSPLPWDFRIYTPPCYDSQVDRAYPLLILIHGSGFTDSQWDDLGADETADALIGSGAAPPFIILMPRDRIWVAPVRDPFGEALVTRILPWVDQNYRTIPDRDHRAIGGLSRGASWAVHLGLRHWPEFSAIGAHSLPIFLSDPPYIPSWLDEIPPEMLPRIYLDIGDHDHLLDKAEWFENLLTELNIPHEWHLNTGRHEMEYWEAHVQEYLLWYASGW
jgi:enterochelin esterase-like enzyme